MSKLPQGFHVAGHHCGLKQSTDNEDITLIFCDRPCVAAGVYTQNQVVAAPVILDRERTPTTSARAVIINSGNANACTGEPGMQNAQRMVELTAKATGVESCDVLLMSTGIIGEQLPMARIEDGIQAVSQKLGTSATAVEAAARGILTTDTKTKVAAISSVSGPATLGIAKGSGMIGPNMATMLGVIMTDASLSISDAQNLLRKAVDKSFNSINVDGHTSTNDTVLLLASGNDDYLDGEARDTFAAELEEVCVSLAKKIVDDGEGASHLIEICVRGAQSDSDARRFAEAIANSPLVKTAIAGNDPNWGRIVSAAGYAKATMDVSKTSLQLNGVPIFKNGAPLSFDAAQLSASLRRERDVLVEMWVGVGAGTATFWTCDLTHGYVTINADYHT